MIRLKSFKCVQRVSVVLLLISLGPLIYLFSQTDWSAFRTSDHQLDTKKEILLRLKTEEQVKAVATTRAPVRNHSMTIENMIQNLPPKKKTWIRTSHKNSSALFHKDVSNDTVKYCDMWPAALIGAMKITPETTINEIKDKSALDRVEVGGAFKPRDCTAREKVAIIIPYRDREDHLQILINHLHSVLQRQHLEYGIFVVEMAYPAQFNRGILANVGFLTSSSIKEYTCYIIHDVDLLVVDDRNIYRCGHVPRHLTAYVSKFKYNLPYLSYFGGVCAFTQDQFSTVNGFSNLYFGWGGEDDDMVARIINSGMHFSRPKKSVGGFVALKHTKDTGNPPNPHRMALRLTSGRRREIEGVKNLKYNRLAVEFKELYTWVYISVKEAEIMAKYEEYLHPPEEHRK